MHPQPATLEQIAREAGVSTATVFRVVNSKGKGIRRGATERAKTILEICDRLNYRPNAAAKATRLGRSNAVTLLLSEEKDRSFLPFPLLYAIHDELANLGLHLNLARLPEIALADRTELPKLLRELSADGILINYHSNVPKKAKELLDRVRTPAIWINVKTRFNSVYPDDLAAGRSAANYFIKAGHKRIAYVQFLEWQHYSMEDRATGYANAMKEADLEPIHITAKLDFRTSNHLDREAAFAPWLNLPPRKRPTAFITYGDFEAASLYLLARSLGMSIPKDLSLLSFFIGEQLSIGGFPVTTLTVPEQAIAGRAVALLVEKIKAPNIDIKSEALPFLWLPGES